MPDPFPALITEQHNITFQCTNCAKQKHQFSAIATNHLDGQFWFSIMQMQRKISMFYFSLNSFLTKMLPVYSWQNFGCDLQSRAQMSPSDRNKSFIIHFHRIKNKTKTWAKPQGCKTYLSVFDVWIAVISAEILVTWGTCVNWMLLV